VICADLFCCGGGAAQGLYEAGFTVVGVDIEPQPDYPFEFHQADVMTLGLDWFDRFDAIWASPPCQGYSKGAGKAGRQHEHPDLVAPTRDLLEATGLPYVIENITEAEKRAGLRRDLQLCGFMFGLPLIRHRTFESNVPLTQLEHVPHGPNYVTVAGNPGGSSKRDGTKGFGSVAAWKEAMGIDWLPSSRLKQAIPPAYARHIGADLMRALRTPSSDTVPDPVDTEETPDE